jgi:hypothetical protein
MLSKLKERMDKYDKANAEYENDRAKFIQTTKDKAASLKVKGDKKDKLMAKAGIQLQNEIQVARAEKVVNNMEFEEFLRREPKETIVSTGVQETVMNNGVPTTMMIPEELRIRHLRWVLLPGIPTVVPASVAAMFRDRQRLKEETLARQNALTKLMEKDKLDAEMARINSTYHSNSN